MRSTCQNKRNGSHLQNGSSHTVIQLLIITVLSLIRIVSIGNVVSLSIFNRTIIILNSSKAAIELLHKRSSIYSDRPYLAMGGEL